MLVSLKGLVGSPEKNGARGTLNRFAQDTGRWTVVLQSSGEKVCAKPENLTFEVETAKEAASYKPLIKAPTTQSLGSYYGTDPDNYKKARVVRPGDVKATNFDHKLYVSMSQSLNDAGAVNVPEFDGKIWPEIADGRAGRQELTCNERWTIRYGLGEFNWGSEARLKLMLAMPTIDVMGLDGKKETDVKVITELLRGPSLEELTDPPAKKRKTGNAELIWVDGMYLDKKMLKVVRAATGDDGVVDCFEAVPLYHAAADGGELTCCERWTLRFILSAYVFTDAAFMFIKEALVERGGKIKYTDSLLP
jgi:hypothetical protein